MVIEMVVSKNPGEFTLAATDSDGELLTAVERIDDLFINGLKFEAAVSQMAIVEGLSLLYLKGRMQADNVKIVEDIEDLHRKKRLTFGKIKDIIVNNKVLHDESILEDFVAYVGYRNDIAHNLVSRFNKVDLDNFYTKGKNLISFFREYLLVIIQMQGV